MDLTTTPGTNSSRSFHGARTEDQSNSSATFPNDDPTLLLYIANFERIFIPCISIPGLIGNLLSAIIFLGKALRKSRCSLFIAARCLNDMAFLLCLLFVWVSVTFDLNLVHVYGACHTVIFITFFTGFMAVWLCGCITFENYLIMSNKIATKRWYTSKTPVVFIATLSAVGICVYVSSLWTVGENCYLNHEYVTLTQILMYSDILLTFIVPATVIIALLTLICIRAKELTSEKRRRSSSQTMCSSQIKVAIVASPAERVAKMLLVYTILLLTLHCPSHAMTLYLMINMSTKDTPVVTTNQAALRSGLQMIFYLGFTLNFVVFYCLSQNFRKEFLKIFCCRRDNPRALRTEVLPLTCQRRHTVEGFI